MCSISAPRARQCTCRRPISTKPSFFWTLSEAGIVVEDAGAHGLDAEIVEDMGEEGARRLGGIAGAPMPPTEPVPELALAPDAGEADSADDQAIAGDHQRQVLVPIGADRGEEAFGIDAAIGIGHARQHPRHREVVDLRDDPVDIGIPRRPEHKARRLEADLRQRCCAGHRLPLSAARPRI